MGRKGLEVRQGRGDASCIVMHHAARRCSSCRRVSRYVCMMTTPQSWRRSPGRRRAGRRGDPSGHHGADRGAPSGRGVPCPSASVDRGQPEDPRAARAVDVMALPQPRRPPAHRRSGPERRPRRRPRASGSSTPISSVPPAVFAKATIAFSTPDGEVRSRLISASCLLDAEADRPAPPYPEVHSEDGPRPSTSEPTRPPNWPDDRSPTCVSGSPSQVKWAGTAPVAGLVWTPADRLIPASDAPARAPLPRAVRRARAAPSAVRELEVGLDPPAWDPPHGQMHGSCMTARTETGSRTPV